MKAISVYQSYRLLLSAFCFLPLTFCLLHFVCCLLNLLPRPLTHTTLAFCFLLFAFCPPAQAQDTISFTYRSFGLESEDDNVIHNAAHLDDFFESLHQLREKQDRKINIVHIGDSHIQGDYMSSVTRRNFQKRFGNGGRGLIVPFSVAGTNEPPNFKTTSPISWNSKRCIYTAHPLPIGIGGITITTDQPNTSLSIYMNDLWMDYAFNTVTLFYLKNNNSFDFSVRDTADRELGIIDSTSDNTAINHSKIILPASVNEIQVKAVKSLPWQNHATIFGLSMETSGPGIVYHAIGVNGAKYMHYNSATFFAHQTSVLSPALFIISLGTNESLDYPYLDKNFYYHIDKFVTSLHQVNPNAKFILVTPPDAFRRKIKINPGIESIRQQIIRYAVENGLAFYDMYKALGGAGSAGNWRNATLLRSDGVHYSKEGYEYQGNLLFNAIMKSYNNYVPVRQP